MTWARALEDDRIAYRRSRAVVAIFLVLAYAACEIVLFSRHAPFRDEAQAWLWARELNRPQDWFAVPGEGHPPLWFWLLRGLSFVADFDHARLAGLVIAFANAVLLAILEWRKPLLVFAFLGSLLWLDYWGFNFRPYGLVLALSLAAILLDKRGRPVLATWLLAIACGLHFFAGFVFAMWLVARLGRGLARRAAAAPALLALCFGALAILSGAGNPASALDFSHLAARMLATVAAPFQPAGLPAWPIAIAIAALAAIGLRHDRRTLFWLLAIVLSFALFTSLVYGRMPWHQGFIVLLLLMGFELARPLAPRWPLVLAMLPQVMFGAFHLAQLREPPAQGEYSALAAVTADAGGKIDSEHRLVAWPDFVLTAPAASFAFRYLDATSGRLLGPVNWRERKSQRPDPALLARIPTPYWLVCLRCPAALETIEGLGLSAVPLVEGTTDFGEQVGAYRIESTNNPAASRP